MKIISPKLHAYLDYVISGILILFPLIFGYKLEEADSWIPLVAGLTFLTYTIFTRFRDEHFGIISLKTHLILDVITGLAVAITPWFGEFAGRPPYIQTILGIMIWVFAAMTQVVPYEKVSNKTLH